jgi:hypothetical protein
MQTAQVENVIWKSAETFFGELGTGYQAGFFATVYVFQLDLSKTRLDSLWTFSGPYKYTSRAKSQRHQKSVKIGFTAE